jgi:carbon storage regulator
MLIMKRRAGEAILIGEDIEIRLEHIGRTRVRIGIIAPRGVAVVAKEVKVVGEENRAAADGATVAALLASLSGGAGGRAVARLLESQPAAGEGAPERLSPASKT